MGKAKKTVTIISITIAAFLLIGIIITYTLLGRINRENISQGEEDLGIGLEEPWDLSEFEDLEGMDNGLLDENNIYQNVEGISNIALFGIDAAEGTRGRSDSIMIVTVDENSYKIKLSSIVRDSYVNIPDRGMDKIGHAYAFGGPQLALKTINSNFKLDIKHYATVNFTTLPIIIDTVGGVKIKITAEEAKHVPGIESEGTYLLDGNQALAFSRIRKLQGGDFERSRRQRDVIKSLINAGMDMNIRKYPSFINNVLPHVTTNLSSNEILSLATKVAINNIDTMEDKMFPESEYSQGAMLDRIYYYVFNQNKAIESIHEFIYK